MCELCNLEKRTKWYYEDDEFIICDCETCKVPMVVSKKHTDSVTRVTEGFIYGLVKGVFKKKLRFRITPRKIFDHFHWHIVFEE